MVTFTHIIYYVQNVEKAVTFYTQVFDLPVSFLHESGEYAELAAGSIKLAFASDQLGQLNLSNKYYKNNQQAEPAGCELVFTTNTVDELFKKALAAGAKEIAAPAKKPWGQTIGYVQDPQGILIEIASIVNEESP